MTPRALLDALRPAGYGDSDVEAFQAYLPRVRALLPNFPEDVLEQWFYRHYNCAVDDYGYMGLDGLKFSRVSWPTSRILRDVGTWSERDLTQSWTTQLRHDHGFQNSWLGKAMIRDGTWPVSIMVISNSQDLQLPNGVKLARPFHLMEGHHRFGYLRALEQDERWRAQAEHDIWLVEVDSLRVLDYWPMNDAFVP